MTWHTSRDVQAFVAAAGDFLAAQPVVNTVLLTEAAYLAARPSDAPDQLYGWWQPPGGEVTGAFLRAPRHPPILSLMPDEAAKALLDKLTDLTAVGVDGRLADSIMAMSGRLRQRSRIKLYRLGELHLPSFPAGRARVAKASDRALLVAWYHELMRKFPGDPSELAYVVDDPLGYGGITLWEVDGEPRAMAGRSRLVAGMVRLSAVYAPHDPSDGDAAFAAACDAAQTVAQEVLAFAAGIDTAADTAYRRLGFEPVLDRVMLGA